MNATLAGSFLLRVLICLCVGVVTYYGASLIQTIFHRFFGHSHRMGKLYQVHVGGHHAQYAPQLLSDRWIRTEQHITWYYAIPFTHGAYVILAASREFVRRSHGSSKSGACTLCTT